MSRLDFRDAQRAVPQILVVAPHPDDEVIGCGGSIRKRADRDEHVTVLTVVERGRSVLDSETTSEELSREVDDAHRELGIRGRIDLGARERDLAMSRELLLEVVGVLRRMSPSVVYLPHEEEADVEHQLVNRMTTEALWMAQSPFFEDCGPVMPPPRLVLGYEVWTPMGKYQYLERIDDVIDTKVSAMRCFRSQLKLAPWDEAIRGLAAYRGVAALGGGYAEVFSVLSLGAVF